MAETPKRLKKNISFSEHERDIYEYLDKQGNASAFIKRLILNHMLMEQGIVVPRAVVKDKEDVPQGTDDKETNNNETEQSNEPSEPLEPSEDEVVESTEDETTESNEDEVVESNETQTNGGMELSEEDKINQGLLPNI